MSDWRQVAYHVARRGARLDASTEPVTGHDCVSCIRKRYGGQECCSEGWDHAKAAAFTIGDGNGCTNWAGWDGDMAGAEPEGEVAA